MAAVVALDDGSVVAAGFVSGTWDGGPSRGQKDFTAVKIASDGTLLWRWQVSLRCTVPWYAGSSPDVSHGGS